MGKRSLLLGFLMIGAVLTSCDQSGKDLTARTYLSALQAYENQEFDQALRLAREAQGQDKSFAPAYNLAGRVLYTQSDFEGAAREFRRAFDLQNSSVDTRIWLARALVALEASDEALVVLNTVLADEDTNPAALRMLSKMAIERGETAESLYLLEQAIMGQGELGLIFMDRAELLWAAGKNAAAIDDIQIALKLLPSESRLWSAANELLLRMNATRVGIE
ncbi:MAG: hypothetical protein A2087_09590 [Spirochaetes bacterium GWD1_61_31]|nr:MAG: hypothetical protein A2Y37_07185 [Spirochaetes bacterium GWB1_60_80]OHD29254.1 MAG: hypothetical protein A2004_09090 [Spirochaetes bacterium GWC1_61_12]OHD39256.1 MAG: hypothetical protein A2087_09590 [Spirochaetes bacterium GWD1_61_31]OHD43659.1 MAG: hypothetical protein A2Y35_06380 [Spirochaetes bacterium GWE1_60_18]OHD59164.1 MAG: hypothetical protein A2Y32_14870 [Spirochaetes bacterium GWF1_60_12]